MQLLCLLFDIAPEEIHPTIIEGGVVKEYDVVVEEEMQDALQRGHITQRQLHLLEALSGRNGEPQTLREIARSEGTKDSRNMSQRKIRAVINLSRSPRLQKLII